MKKYNYNEEDKLKEIQNKIIECQKKINQLNEYDQKKYNDFNFYLACYKYLIENINMEQKEYDGEIPTIKIKK